MASFEAEFAAFCGAPFCVGTASGTDAITIALLVAGVCRPEQEVITSPLTAPFTAQAVLRAGARVRFADLDPDTLLLDAGKVRQVISRNTAAVLPVHLYGQTCNLEQWSALAREAGVALVQDACQAHGARHGGFPLTHYSPYVAYSFYPTKNLGALGDGGALCLTNEADAARARLLRDGGRSSDHMAIAPALNSRLDELQAAYLRIALRHLEHWNRTRARLAAIYDEELARIPASLLRPVGRDRGSGHAYHLYVVRAARREALREHLRRFGVGTGIHYSTPLHLQPAFRCSGLKPGDLPVAERAAEEVLSLPLGVHVREQDVRRVAAVIRQFYLG